TAIGQESPLRIQPGSQYTRSVQLLRRTCHQNTEDIRWRPFSRRTNRMDMTSLTKPDKGANHDVHDNAPVCGVNWPRVQLLQLVWVAFGWNRPFKQRDNSRNEEFIPGEHF